MKHYSMQSVMDELVPTLVHCPRCCWQQDVLECAVTGTTELILMEKTAVRIAAQCCLIF